MKSIQKPNRKYIVYFFLLLGIGYYLGKESPQITTAPDRATQAVDKAVDGFVEKALPTEAEAEAEAELESKPESSSFSSVFNSIKSSFNRILPSKNRSNTPTLDFDDSKTIVDVLQLSQYASLGRDKAYKEYVDDYWELSFSFYRKAPDYVEMMAVKPSKEIQSKKRHKKGEQSDPVETAHAFLSMGKLVGNGLLAAPGAIKTGLKLVLLEKKHDELLKGFSEAKKAEAKLFEKELKKLLEYSSYLLQYELNNKVPNYINYKYVNPILKSDDEVMDLVAPLLENADEFFLLSIDLKAKVAINYLLTEDDSGNSSLVDYGTSILNSNGEESIDIKSSLLDDYYSALNKLVHSLTVLEKGEFSTPVEDWSEAKKASLDLLVGNIREKAEQEVNALNEFEPIKH